jgi:UDP-N-acetyl-D-glucosamine dehydrogenase
MLVGIMGLCYVGLPLAVALAEEGHDVLGLDTDPAKIESLRNGTSYIEDITSERLQAVSGHISA